VKTFRHAVSLDEHRAKFKANLWNRQTPEEKNLGLDINRSRRERLRELEVIKNGHHSKEAHKQPTSPVTPRGKRGSGGATLWKLDNDSDRRMDQYETIYSDAGDEPTDVEEVWFAVCIGCFLWRQALYAYLLSLPH
jgi:hypothetical protein